MQLPEQNILNIIKGLDGPLFCKLMELSSEINQDTQVGLVPQGGKGNKGKFDRLIKPRSSQAITSFQLRRPLWSLTGCASSVCFPILCAFLYPLSSSVSDGHLVLSSLLGPDSSTHQASCELVCLCSPQRYNLSLNILCYLWEN